MPITNCATRPTYLEGIREHLQELVAIATPKIQSSIAATAQQIIQVGRELFNLKNVLKPKEYRQWLSNSLGWVSRNAKNLIETAIAFENLDWTKFSTCQPETLFKLAKNREVLEKAYSLPVVTPQIAERMLKEAKPKRCVKPKPDPISGWKRMPSGGGRYYSLLLHDDETGTTIEKIAREKRVLPQQVIQEAVAQFATFVSASPVCSPESSVPQSGQSKAKRNIAPIVETISEYVDFGSEHGQWAKAKLEKFGSLEGLFTYSYLCEQESCTAFEFRERALVAERRATEAEAELAHMRSLVVQELPCIESDLEAVVEVVEVITPIEDLDHSPFVKPAHAPMVEPAHSPMVEKSPLSESAQMILNCDNWLGIAETARWDKNLMLQLMKEIKKNGEEGPQIIKDILVDFLVSCPTQTALEQIAWIPKKLADAVRDRLRFSIMVIEPYVNESGALDARMSKLSGCRWLAEIELGTCFEKCGAGVAPPPGNLLILTDNLFP